jgi:glycosyltransferase involved in cell wall biosynthesis
MDNPVIKPIASAIMIVYNGEAYIDKAIDAVLLQTYKNFEFLIFNDGSIDATDEKINKKIKRDNRIQYYKNVENFGLAKARNFIISKAIGKYIIVTDADDICLPDRFEKQITYMEENNNIAIFGAAVELIDHQERNLFKWTYPLDDIAIKNGLKNSCAVANPSCIFKKTVFDTLNGYNEKLSICEDWDFFLRAANYFKFSNSAEPNILYRIHDNNMSKNKLEATVVYAMYNAHQLNIDCLNYSIKSFILHYPELKKDVIKKIQQFYGFWIETFTVMKYNEAAKNLSDELKENLFHFFNKEEKRLFEKNSIKLYLKVKNIKLTLQAIRNYLTI